MRARLWCGLVAALAVGAFAWWPLACASGNDSSDPETTPSSGGHAAAGGGGHGAAGGGGSGGGLSVEQACDQACPASVACGQPAEGGGDAGTDAGDDAGSDAGGDAGSDAGMDGGSDAGTDAGSDAGSTTWPPNLQACLTGCPLQLGHCSAAQLAVALDCLTPNIDPHCDFAAFVECLGDDASCLSTGGSGGGGA